MLQAYTDAMQQFLQSINSWTISSGARVSGHFVASDSAHCRCTAFTAFAFWERHDRNFSIRSSTPGCCSFSERPFRTISYRWMLSTPGSKNCEQVLPLRTLTFSSGTATQARRETCRCATLGPKPCKNRWKTLNPP